MPGILSVTALAVRRRIKVGPVADLILSWAAAHPSLVRYGLDGLRNPVGHCVVDHVPGFLDQPEVAAADGVVEPDGMALVTDDTVLSAGHDHDRQIEMAA